MNHTKFAVSRFENRNGATSWRVDGRLHGVRFRKNFKTRRDRFAKKFNLTHDVLRHTFISMFVAKFRSIGEAAIQAGNSESIILRHYLDLKNAAEADQFWAILPQHASCDNVVSLPAHPPTLSVAV